MKSIITSAEEKDLRSIQELNHLLFIKEQEVYDSTFDLDWTFWEIWTTYFKNRISSNNACVLVAKDNHQIIWYLSWSLSESPTYRKTKKQAELENMYILESYRGVWVWTQLMESFLIWAKDNWAEWVQVTASAGNIQWIEFYQKIWFKNYDITLEYTL